MDGTPGTADMPGRLEFLTTADGAATPTERLRISSNGDVRVGGGTPSTFGSGTTVLSTYNASTYVANLVTSGSTTLQMIASQTHGASSIGTRSNHNLNLTTNDTTRLTINTNGYVTKPAHPAFFVTMNGGDQTTAAANILPFDTVVHNNGGHYKTSGSNIYHFVCPVAGYYFFGGQVWLKHGSGTGNHARWEIWRDSTIVALAGWHQNGVNLNDHQSAATVTIYCDVGAKVYMEADYALTYWRGNAGNPHTFFHGHLIG